MQPTLLVVAAVIVQGDRVLVTRRPNGSPLAGYWEFPGGKVEAGEHPRDALVRELREELGVQACVREPVDVTYHQDAHKSVVMILFHTRLAEHSPPPQCLGVDAIAWRQDHELQASDFPPADVAALSAVRELLSRQPGAATS